MKHDWIPKRLRKQTQVKARRGSSGRGGGGGKEPDWYVSALIQLNDLINMGEEMQRLGGEARDALDAGDSAASAEALRQVLQDADRGDWAVSPGRKLEKLDRAARAAEADDNTATDETGDG